MVIGGGFAVMAVVSRRWRWFRRDGRGFVFMYMFGVALVRSLNRSKMFTCN